MEITCANCGDPVSPAGRTPATGRRYCSTKPECINAKQRARYHRTLDTANRRMEDRKCSSCNVRLPVRSWRSTDTELGRWCRKKQCQFSRQTAEQQASPEVREYRTKVIRNAFENADVRPCNCGRRDARLGFTHPNPEMNVCFGVGENVPPMDLARALWAPKHADQ